ncbi:MAG: hypothetical protein WAM14_26405, partial [Candidatus Nitrosopolaris sp.]
HLDKVACDYYFATTAHTIAASQILTTIIRSGFIEMQRYLQFTTGVEEDSTSTQAVLAPWIYRSFQTTFRKYLGGRR